MTFRMGPGGAPADPRLERRLALGAFLVIFVWTVVLARLFFLQVVEGDRFRVSAERNSVRTHRIPATRGIVWDRNGTRYGQGAGLLIWANGRQLAKSATLQRLTATLPTL